MQNLMMEIGTAGIWIAVIAGAWIAGIAALQLVRSTGN